jgi:DNA-binding NarL/FixJ family response regulator
MPDETIRTLLVDDHDLVRKGLAAALRPYPEFTIVGEAADGEAAIQAVERFQPDLVVLDVRMPGMSGIEACREIVSRNPDVGVLMLTSFSDEQAVMSAIMAGARGFMLKDVRTNDLINAMRTVARGGSTLDPASTTKILERFRQAALLSEEDRLAQGLSEREREILALIADGLTNREIGEQLYLSEKTVKHHVSDILAHLGLTRRIDAAVFETRRSERSIRNE